MSYNTTQGNVTPTNGGYVFRWGVAETRASKGLPLFTPFTPY